MSSEIGAMSVSPLKTQPEVAVGDVKLLGGGEAVKTAGADNGAAAGALAEMTSKDYYFDSYAHFGIHEVNRGAQQKRVLNNKN